MSQTFLTHIGCNGSIVINATKTAKLVAPSFSINSAGISSLVLDIQVVEGGKLTPAFECVKCGKEFSNVEVETGLMAHCQICGNDTPVSELLVHTEITCICSTCMKAIKAQLTTGITSQELIAEYIEQFGLNSRMKTVSMIKVLTSPITL
jgi:hypothetical protein